MNFKQGAMEGIEHRHYFRDEIFYQLSWAPGPKKPHLERAEATFELVVKGLNYGKFNLQLSHNTRTTTKSYRQGNAMTEIRWGKAKAIIAKRDLLKRVMYLYKKDTDPPEYMIKIA